MYALVLLSSKDAVPHCKREFPYTSLTRGANPYIIFPNFFNLVLISYFSHFSVGEIFVFLCSCRHHYIFPSALRLLCVHLICIDAIYSTYCRSKVYFLRAVNRMRKMAVKALQFCLLMDKVLCHIMMNKRTILRGLFCYR